MKLFYIFLLILSTNVNIHAQSLRELIIHADLIVTGKTIWDDSQSKNDSTDSDDDYYTVCEVIKGEFDGEKLPVKNYFSLGFDIIYIEEGMTEVLFLRKGAKDYNLFKLFSGISVTPIKEMLEIIKISNSEKRFSLILEWHLKTLESGVYHNAWLDYSEINIHSTFFNYYKELGYFNSIDSVFSFEQKTRILNRLLKIKNWDYYEKEFATLIYKEFPHEIEQHILKMIKENIHENNFSLEDLNRLLEIINDGKYSDPINILIDKINKYLYSDKIIIKSVKELEQILKGQ